MTYRQFTSQELFCIAQVAHKKTLYGIPDGFEMLPEDERPLVQAEVLDNLLSKQIITMNADGKAAISNTSYQELITTICDCEACLTVNYQFGHDREEDVVFWKTEAGLLKADVIDGHFVFISEDALGLKNYLSTIAIKSGVFNSDESVTIPQIALAKAKRAMLDGKKDDARRILLQNGAGNFADVILSGLEENADFLSLLIMINRPEEKSPQQAAFMGTAGILLALSDTVLNYRNCTTFSSCSENDVANQIQSFLDIFLASGQEVLR